MNDLFYEHSPDRPVSRWVRTHWPILALLGTLLVAGLCTMTAYGLSWDEGLNVRVGESALAAYTGSGAYFSQPAIDEHGPIYFMVFSISGRAVQRLVPGWTAADGRHLTNFVTFLLGVLLLYLLCLRFMKPKSAWFGAALFASQPLLFGYAFVNQKDIPFMTFFIASVLVGMVAVDSLAGSRIPSSTSPSGQSSSAPPLAASLKMEWQRLSLGLRIALGLLSVFAVALAVDLLATHLLRGLLESTLVAAYQGNAPAPMQWLFSKVATDAYKTPLSLYTDKLDQLYMGYGGVAGILLMMVPLVSFSSKLPTLASRWGFGRNAILSPLLLAASLLLGITTCIRQVGLFAVALVGLYMLLKLREQALFPALLMTVFSAFATWLTWPYLWPNPLGNFTSSLFLASDFPSRAALFEGVSYGSRNLPWTFFPVMASIELTEPAVGLTVFGVLMGFWRAWRHQVADLAAATILVMWIAVPLAMLFFSSMTAYGNIRQLLFLLPPMFVLAGLGFEMLSRWLIRRWAQALLMVAFLLPGLVGTVHLFPYEYIYFNSFAGGVDGAVGRFELDRWCLSSRAAIGVVNELAPPGATVIVPIQTDQVAPFARPDLQLSSDLPMYPEADFVISCTYRSYGDWHTTAYQDVYNISRGKAILTSIWKRAGSP